jgi:hypothetical protein
MITGFFPRLALPENQVNMEDIPGFFAVFPAETVV